MKFHPFGRKPFTKKDCIAIVTSSPITFQAPLKNSVVNPYGPGDLLPDIWNNTSFISSLVTSLPASNNPLHYTENPNSSFKLSTEAPSEFIGCSVITSTKKFLASFLIFSSVLAIDPSARTIS